jgi:lysophospholipase L1-like esterase
MRTLPPRTTGGTGQARASSGLATTPAALLRALPGLARSRARVERQAGAGRPAAVLQPGPNLSNLTAWADGALSALDRGANRVAALLPPQARRWVLRAAGACGGTIGLLGLVITAEALRIRGHPFLPETAYDRILRFPGTAEDGGTPLTLAVLGDSTTTGIGTERVEDTYAALVGQALATRGPVEVHVLGRAGARLADVLADQLPLAKTLSPDLVLLVVGANDSTHVTPLVDVRARARSILGELAGTPLVVAGVPRLSLARVVPFPLRELSYYRGLRVTAIMRRAAARHPEVHFVSLSMRPVGLEGAPLAWLSTDRFHPSAWGYAQWANAFIPALLAADPRARRVDSAVEAEAAVELMAGEPRREGRRIRLTRVRLWPAPGAEPAAG